MGPALRYTLDELKLVSEEKNPLNELKKDLAVGARLSSCDLPPLSDYQEVNLTKLTNKYVKALEENTNNRFDESLLFLRLSEYLMLVPFQINPRRVSESVESKM